MSEEDDSQYTPIDNNTRPINQELIEEYSSDERIISFIENKFKRIGVKEGRQLLRLILSGNVKINVKDFKENHKSFLRHNLSKFSKEGDLKIEELKDIKLQLNGLLNEIGKPLVNYNETIEDGLEKIDEECYKLDKNSTYDQVRKLTCDEYGKPKFKYEFNNPDLPITFPKNKMILQRVKIQIIGFGVKFDYPIEFVYNCLKCGTRSTRKAYEVTGTKERNICEGRYTYTNSDGEIKSRQCSILVDADKNNSKTKDAFYFNINYEDEKKESFHANAFGFVNYKPGFYECVLFRIKNPGTTELYLIMDIKEIESNIFIVPQKVEGENYLFTLQKALDEYLIKQTKQPIFGLYPIKCALIIQKVFNEQGYRLISNIQIVGDASTGKSLIFKYFGFLLNSHLHMTTNGLSTSVAGLRGTRSSILLFNKDIKINTLGFLGRFKVIHIDEAGENKELVRNLKAFLLEDNYSYDRAGGEGIFYKRTAHVNLSENLDYNHLGVYRGMIRKAYKELNIKIGDEDKSEWDENWDLHLSMDNYNFNPYLRKVIKEKRMEMQQKQLWWVDGYDFALHERFPFYFYLVNNKENKRLIEVTKSTSTNIISENLELMRALKSIDIENFFVNLSKYKDSIDREKWFSQIDIILEQYGIHADIRARKFYYSVLDACRMINQRNNFEKMDLDYIRWILETTNNKIDVVDTDNYNIKGAPDLDKEKKMDDKIENETKILNDFGVQNDFDDD